MSAILNSSISVDCVVFGFDGQALKILLVDCEMPGVEYKLPGSMIMDDEQVHVAANRVLGELTGLKDVFLKHFGIFSDPNRINEHTEIQWLRDSYKDVSRRIVTIGYYSLVKLNSKMIDYTTQKGVHWHRVSQVKRLAFDHKSILLVAFDTLLSEFVSTPIVFELLPNKFTIRQLQNLYEKMLDVDIDNRNFRKKLLSSDYIVATGDKEQGVTHKPAQLYYFDKRRYERELKARTKLNFINWQL